MSSFDLPVRLRRYRHTPARRRLFAETDVSARHLVPVWFVVPGTDIRRETAPGSRLLQVSVDRLEAELDAAVRGGAAAAMLFGVPDEKGIAAATDAHGLVARALERYRGVDLTMMVDVCLCSYTPDGHCGLTDDHGHVHNDATLPVLAEMSVVLARAGADVVCPSDMMDGRVAAIRAALDAAELGDTLICSYAAKMASAFYGPFRLAADSAPKHGDRKSYQMDPRNRREALREVALDVEEGADLILIKPGLTNLDLIRDVRERFDLPVVAYQVSGELAMLRHAAAAGDLDFPRAAAETLYSLRRAGADLVVTYLAPDVWARRLPL